MAKNIAIDIQIKNIKKVADLKKELQALRKEQRDYQKKVADGEKVTAKAAKGYTNSAKAIKTKSKNLRDLNKDLSGANNATKKVTKSQNGMAKQFVKGAAAIGIVVGAFRAVNRVLSSVVSTFTEFEFVMSKVNAVSGATNEEFKALNETAKELGRTTFFTATQVGELMLNYSKLGFTAAEIQDAVQPTLDLATATGSDLARAALVAGAAVRGFGLDASETERVVDVMAVSFSSSAMNIEKWQTSMTKVAPIAKAAGFSIEDTAAIMSKLTDSGIEASIAGTSLRNILLKMQDPSSDLTKAFGTTIHSLDQLVPAMKKFVAEGGSMADIMEVVDLRQAAAFEQMLTTADGTIELRNALLDANGEGKRMADIVGDTLQGAMLKFTSALQGFAIAFMENFAGSMQKGLESAADFMNRLTESAAAIAKFVERLVQVIKFLGIYKTLLIATTAATSALSIATGTASVATLRFMASFRKLTATMMANPYVAVGALLIALATDLFNLRNEVNQTNDSWDAMNKTIKGNQDAFQTRQKIIEALKGELATLDDLRRGKIAMARLDEEIAAGTKSTEAIKAEARKVANTMFREGEEGLKDAYVNQVVRDNETDIRLKERQKSELKVALAIGQKNIKIDENTRGIKALTKATKELQVAELDNTFVTDATRDAYVALMNSVLDGTMKMEDAEKELFDFRVDLLENLIKDESLSYEERMKLEEMLTKMKVKNFNDEQKRNKKQQKEIKDHVKDLGKLGSALQEVAGDNEALNGIRKAGEAITKAAAIAESLLNLQKAIAVIREGKLAGLTLLGTKAKIKNTAATATNTVATGADTVVTGASLGVDATKSVLSSGKMLPWPVNLIAFAATILLIKKIMSMFEDGGIIPDGAKKFAKGGMVQGKSHAQGGEKFSVGGRVVELEGGEAVINKRSTAKYRTQLSAMNADGGGVKFADGGLLNSPQFANQQFNAGMMQSPAMQKVYVVESDITSSQRTVNVLEAGATI